MIASHRNADAKLIAFMDEELKKTNPDYKREIDLYENAKLTNQWCKKPNQQGALSNEFVKVAL